MASASDTVAAFEGFETPMRITADTVAEPNPPALIGDGGWNDAATADCC